MQPSEGMSNQKLLLTSYRALLRWSARCGEAPVRFQTEHLREVCPAISEGKDLLLDSAGLRSMVQWQFRKRVGVEFLIEKGLEV